MKPISLIALLVAAIIPTTAFAQTQCPPLVDFPTEATVAGLMACGREDLARSAEQRMRRLQSVLGSRPAPRVAAPPSPPPVPPVTVRAPPVRPAPVVPPPVLAPVPAPVTNPYPQAAADATREQLQRRLREVEEELRRRQQADAARAATPPPVAPPAPAPQPVVPPQVVTPPVTELGERTGTVPRLPYIGESGSAAPTGLAGMVMPRVASLPGFLHRRPVPWSPFRGLRLWNGLNCDGDFAFAIEVRVDGRVVVPVEAGAAWPAIPVIDSRGRRSTAHLVPQGRDRRAGGYVYIPVGPGDHDVEVSVYDATYGMTPLRLGGGRFHFNPQHGDLHQLRWYEVAQSDYGFCGGR